MKKTPGDIILHMSIINENHKIHGSWDMQHNTDFFVILGHFFPFYSTNNPENQNSKKMEKHLEILSFYICVPQMTIILCVVTEIWSATDSILCHLRPFFALSSHQQLEKPEFWKNEEKKHLEISSFYTYVPQMMIIWCMVPEILSTTNRIFLSFWTILCPFTPLTTQKTKILEKWKRDIESDSQIFIIFDHFLHFYPSNGSEKSKF